MKTKVLLFFIFLSLVASCTSGRKAYQRGNYDEATLKAINRLRASPNNNRAQATLKAAYHQSQVWHQDQIKNLLQSRDAFKWELIADRYAQMNALYDQISTCPSCLTVTGNPVRYTREVEDARLQAAQARYEAGKALLDQNKYDRLTAREAYGHFFVAERYFPGYKDLRILMDEARWYATVKVVVEPIPMHSRTLALSNEFFENKIQEFLRRMPVNEFVQFYSEREAKSMGLKEADHVLLLQFDDFVIGQTLLREKEFEVSKDSVVVGTVDVEGVKKKVYNTVKAKVRQYEKNVVSSGLLDFRIIDSRSNAVLTQEKLPGSFTWVTQWATFNGDERALTPELKKICSLRDVPPPLPQDLFIGFTQPIYSQITAKIQHFYRRF
jgi:hypothetical protein